MSINKKAEAAVRAMLKRDKFSGWAGIRVLEAEDGHATVTMQVRPEMVNGFGICHGGITFSLADSAFAFASNAAGMIAVALEVNISYTAKAVPGDELTAVAERCSETKKIGVYQVRVTNQNDDLVAMFRGTAYKTGRPLDIEEG